MRKPGKAEYAIGKWIRCSNGTHAKIKQIRRNTASRFPRQPQYSAIHWRGSLRTKRTQPSNSTRLIIGHSQAGRLLLVCFTELEEDRIRIGSARRATRKEQLDYED